MAEASIIAQLATQFGAPGLLIGYMVWDRMMRRKDDQAAREEDNSLRRERTESDKALSAALSALTTSIQNLEKK